MSFLDIASFQRSNMGSLTPHVADADEEHPYQFPPRQLNPRVQGNLAHLIQDYNGAWGYALAAVLAQVMGDRMAPQQHGGGMGQCHLNDLLAREHFSKRRQELKDGLVLPVLAKPVIIKPPWSLATAARSWY